MKIIDKCEMCRKNALFPRKRVLNHKEIGRITSQDRMCRKCYNRLKKALRGDLSKNKIEPNQATREITFEK